MTTNIPWADLWQQAQTSNEPCSAGDHRAKVTAAKWSKTKEFQRDMLTLKFVVTEEGEDNGKSAWDRWTIINDNPTALSILFDKLQAIGLSHEHLQAMSPAQIAQHAMGKEVIISTKIGTWNGKPQTDITMVHPLPLGVFPGQPAMHRSKHSQRIRLLLPDSTRHLHLHLHPHPTPTTHRSA